MRWRVFLLVTTFCCMGAAVFQTDPQCETYWDPLSQVWVTVCSGENGGTVGEDSDESGGDGEAGGSCTAGTITVSTLIVGGGGLCEVWEIWHDACTGSITFANLVDLAQGGSCQSEDADPGNWNTFNPCINLVVNSGGAYCQTNWGLDWYLDARVGFPSAFLDLRPYPVTLVRWPSAARNGGTPAASGSGSLDYIDYGGGTEDSPELGDWRDVRLTLRLAPASPVLFFSLQTLGTVALPDVGDSGPPLILNFERPSHPDAGANRLAGQVGLDELPGDMPVFSGAAKSAYRLFWRLTYEKYERDCRPGPDPNDGKLQCRTKKKVLENDGHWEYDWDGKSQGGEITPSMVVNLPGAMAADLDGNGTPDAYWNRKVTVRRMDDSNRIDNSAWAESWSWGGSIYWAVREGQGQIEWP